MLTSHNDPPAYSDQGGTKHGPPGFLRTLREQRGLRLIDVVVALNRIATKRNWERASITKSELSRAERGARWLRAPQLAALAVFYRIPVGELAEGLLRDLGLLPGARRRFAGHGGAP